MAAYVYVMTNRPHGILYIGVTSNIARRAWEHREGVIAGFTAKYSLKSLVFVETHEEISAAVKREQTLKTWRRAWKVRLVELTNPKWEDLYDRLASGS